MDTVTLSKSTTIWLDLCEFLNCHYEILFAANLLDYDYRMNELHQALFKFKNFHFKKNQKIIFSLYDVEYYLPDSKIGFTIENLMRILDDLDIPKSFCQIFTNHHGLTNNIISRYSNINIVENNYCFVFSEHNPTVLPRNAENITHHFCFMSHKKRDHRSYIRLWLELNSRKDKTIMSWHAYQGKMPFIQPTASESNIKSPNNLNNCVFIETSPFTRIRDKISANDFLINLYHQNYTVLDFDYKHSLISKDVSLFSRLNPWLSNVFLNIVAETVFEYPYPYLTEKTFKCFWHLSPFIIVGAPGSLAYLKSIGFKTFSKWINEDYDAETNSSDRLVMIMNELDIISKWSIDYCREVYNDMLSTVLEYNLHHYQNYYCKTLLNQVKKEILNV